MKKFKAIYLILILGILWIGAGIAAYMLLLSPQITSTKEAGTKYQSALNKTKEDIALVQDTYGKYRTDTQQFVDNNRRFHSLQEKMPDIFDMKNRFDKSRGMSVDGMPIDQKGLRLLYQWMHTKKFPKELNKWVRGYRLKNYRSSFDSAFTTGPMGYEDTFTSVRLIEVNFGEETFVAFGYQDLLNKIRSRYGYGVFPLVITAGSAGGGASTSAPGETPAGMPPIPGGGSYAPGMPPATTPGAYPPGMPPIPTGPPRPLAMDSSQRTLRGQYGPGAGPGPGGAPAGPGPGAMPGGQGPGPGAMPDGASGGAAAGGGFGTMYITVDDTIKGHTSAKPALVVKYNAKGYFFTKGWDPNCANPGDYSQVQQALATAKVYMVNPPMPKQPEQLKDGPAILFFFNKIVAPKLEVVVQ